MDTKEWSYRYLIQSLEKRGTKISRKKYDEAQNQNMFLVPN